MPSLFPPAFPPTWVVPPALLVRTPSAPVQVYPISWRFDPVTGDLALDSNGRVILATGPEAAVQGAAIAASTQQVRYRVFSRAFGAALEQAMLQPTHGAVQRALEPTMRTAMRRDSKVRDATDFTFVWLGDSVTVSYTLELSNGIRRRGSVTL